jgi:V/A-type H+-transporting ATPase subunit D
MARENIAPTKSNLLKVKERLETAQEGYDLLEQKREILVMELMRKVEDVKRLESELDKTSGESYSALKGLFIAMGRQKASALARDIRYDFDAEEKTITAAGMKISGLDVHIPRPVLKYSPYESIPQCDEATVAFFKLLQVLAELATVRQVAWRLAREVRKTQRRVNALEKMVIPQAKETKVYIESSLEEKERDAFFSSKLLKKKKDAKERKE